jgi:hypothetical protein
MHVPAKYAEYQSAYRRKRRKTHPEVYRVQRQRYYAKVKADPERAKARREKSRPVTRASRARERVSVKQEVFAAYGAACACCGEREIKFLTIDHTNGGRCTASS